MTGVVQGNDVLFQLYIDGVYLDFVCAKDTSISPATTYTNITTVGDGMWNKYSPQSHGYSITLNGVIKFDTTAVTAFDLLERQIQGLETRYRMIFTDAEDQNTRVIYGGFFIENSSLSGNTGQVGLSDFTFLGNGALKYSACLAEITSISTVVTGDDVAVTLVGVSGSPAYYIYQVDNGFEKQAVTNPFTLLNQPGGFHSLIVIPVCADDKRGMEVETDFYVQVALPVTSCPNVTGANITNRTSTSFNVSWTLSPGNTVSVFVKNLSTQTEISYPNLTGTSQSVTGLTPSTNYEVKLITNCTDGTKSGGVIVNTSTEAAPTNIEGSIFNNHPEVTMDSIVFSGGYDLVYGQIPTPPLSTAGLTNIALGVQNVIVTVTNAGSLPLRITLITEYGSWESTESESFLVNIGYGGISITISQA